MTAASELVIAASGPGDDRERIDGVLSSLDHERAEQVGREVVRQIVSSEAPFGVWGNVGRVFARVGCTLSGTHYPIRRAVIAGMTEGLIAEFAALPVHSTAFELHVEALLTGLAHSMTSAPLGEALAQWEAMITLTANLHTAARAGGLFLEGPAITLIERLARDAIVHQPLDAWLALLAADTSPGTQALDRLLTAADSAPRNLTHHDIAAALGNGMAEACAREGNSPAALSVLAMSIRTVLATQRALRIAEGTPEWHALVRGPVGIIVDHVTTAPATNESVLQLLIEHPGVLATALQEFSARVTTAVDSATQTTSPRRPAARADQMWLIKALAVRLWATRPPRQSAGGADGPHDLHGGQLRGWEARKQELVATQGAFWGTGDHSGVKAFSRLAVSDGAVCRLAAPAMVVLASAHLGRQDIQPFSRLAELGMGLRQRVARSRRAAKPGGAQAIDSAMGALWRSDVSAGNREQIAKIWAAAGAGLPPLPDPPGVGD